MRLLPLQSFLSALRWRITFVPAPAPAALLARQSQPAPRPPPRHIPCLPVGRARSLRRHDEVSCWQPPQTTNETGTKECNGKLCERSAAAVRAPKSTLIFARCRSLHPLPNCGGAPLWARSPRSLCRWAPAPGFSILRLRRHRSTCPATTRASAVASGVGALCIPWDGGKPATHRLGRSSQATHAPRPQPRSTGTATSTPPTAAGCRARAATAAPQGRCACEPAAAPAAAGCARPGARRSAAGPRAQPRAAGPRTRSQCYSPTRSRCSPCSKCPRRTGAAPSARRAATG